MRNLRADAPLSGVDRIPRSCVYEFGPGEFSTVSDRCGTSRDSAVGHRVTRPIDELSR